MSKSLTLFKLSANPLERMLLHVANIQIAAQEMLGSSGQLVKNLNKIDHYRDLRARYIKWMALYNAVDEAIERTFNTEGFPNIYDVAIGSTSECRAKLNEASRIINAPIASLFLAELSKFNEFDAEEGKTILKKLGVYTEHSGKIVVDENGGVTLEDSTGGESIEIRQPQNNTWEYTIQPGDTLSELANKYHTTVEELCDLNNITNPNLITAGGTLIIPNLVKNWSVDNSDDAKKSSTDNTSDDSKDSPAESIVNVNKSFKITTNGDKTTYKHNIKNQSQLAYPNTLYEIVVDGVEQKGEKPKTIKSGGCGPSAFATCVNAIKGEGTTNPEIMCKYAQDCGARTTDQGTSEGILISRYCAENDGISYEHISNCTSDSMNKLVEALKEGKVAVISATYKDNLFTSGDSGHLIAVTGVEIDNTTGQANLILSDPYNYEGKWTDKSFPSRQKYITDLGDGTVKVDAEVAKNYLTSIYIISD